jgi:hypothetical protein
MGDGEQEQRWRKEERQWTRKEGKQVPVAQRWPCYRPEKEFLNAMTTPKQKRAAKANIKKAASAAKTKRTISHLPKKTRTALGKEGAKAARRKKATG